VSALGPILRNQGGVWVGWEGRTGEASEPFDLEGFHVHPVPLSADELREYYHGFSNATIWPLYHDVVRPPKYHRIWWRRYELINERFARTVAELAGRGDLVWVQDYHLQRVPRLLRDMRPDLRIGFFLHTPFPPPELFSQLPWRKEILKGLLGADVIGFQTTPGAGNFIRLAKRFTSARGVRPHLETEGRRIRVDAYPVSIDFDRFEGLAQDRGIVEQAEAFRERLGGDRKIILGVDRLDYTKGIDVRLKAYRELLANRDFSVEDVAFVQCAVPSRESVFGYEELRERVERLVGSINGEFGSVGSVAVHYLHRDHTPEQLASLYLAADVMLVTPLRDGMNLVAKEYVATRIHDDGVLILSEFTGAAIELKQALVVNPHDVDGLASTLGHALTMPAKEAARRMRLMRDVVRQHTVHEWGKRFLEDLSRR
jgi:trehalose 6-phosphate synthase